MFFFHLLSPKIPNKALSLNLKLIKRNLSMKKTVAWGKMALLLLFPISLLTSCSEESPSKISRTIKQIKIWETDAKESSLKATVTLSYDNSGKLTQISGDNSDGEPILDINYTYPDEQQSFLFTYATEGNKLTRISGTLENGRAYSCQFTDYPSSIAYTYSQDGYLNRSNRKDLVMEYAWNKGNLTSIKATSRIYNTEYKTSIIPNNYSIDLNVLPHLLEDDEYRQIMNTYCWLAGILGKRSKRIAEDDTYDYTYSFDEYGRISSIELKHLLNSTNSAFRFYLSYEE